jgi:hypothetical protein
VIGVRKNSPRMSGISLNENEYASRRNCRCTTHTSASRYRPATDHHGISNGLSTTSTRAASTPSVRAAASAATATLRIQTRAVPDRRKSGGLTPRSIAVELSIVASFIDLSLSVVS